MTVMLLMTWDILPGREQEYFEFVVRDFIPGLQNLGMQPSDAWYTMYGEQPQIMAGAEIDSMTTLQRIRESPQWDELIESLLEYVNNLNYKVVPSRSGFQL